VNIYYEVERIMIHTMRIAFPIWHIFFFSSIICLSRNDRLIQLIL